MKFLFQKDHFNNHDFETFESLDKYLIDETWRKIVDISEIPREVPCDVANCILDFESYSNNFQDKNEWGNTYNLSTGEDWGVKTDYDPNHIKLTTSSENLEDDLFSIYTHFSGNPPSLVDIKRCISNNNSLKFVGIDSFKDLFLMETLNKKVGRFDLQIIRKEMLDCRKRAIEDFINYKNRNIFNIIKVKFISSDILNKYIKFYWWFK